MCHSNRLTAEQTRQLERMTERWQIKALNRIEEVRGNPMLHRNSRISAYDAAIRDAFDEVVAEMDKSGERILEAATR
jgi:hypothetical protein